MARKKPKASKREVDIKLKIQKGQFKQAKKRRAKPFARRRMAMSKTAELAMSMADPFNKSACIPDGSKGPICFTIKEEILISTGTGTCCGVFSSPAPNNFHYTDTGSANATATVAGNWDGAKQLSTITNTYYKYRPVSGGIRATYVGPTQTDGGTLILGQIASGAPISNQNGDNLNGMSADCEYYEVVSQRAGGEVTWRPQDVDDQANFLTALTSVGAVTSATNQPTIFAYVYGATASQAQQCVQVVWHYEGIATNSTYGGGIWGQQPEPAEPGWYERSQNMLNSYKPIRTLLQSGLDLVKGVMGADGFTAARGNGYPQVSGISENLHLGWY
jgi:hypothetical protein